jgi:hypothetical protein
MSRAVWFLSFVVLAVSICSAQSTESSTQSSASPAPAGRAAIPTSLAKSLDAKKLKVGDEVTTNTTLGMQIHGTFIPSGSKVVGHVTSVETRAQGASQSSLGIAFDKIELPGGKALPIHGAIQAVGANPRPELTTGAAGSGTLSKDTGSQGATVPGPVSTVGNLGADPEQAAGPKLDLHGTGVLGIRNLELDKDAVLVTTAKDLKLDSGTQVMIRAEILPSAQ